MIFRGIELKEIRRDLKSFFAQLRFSFEDEVWHMEQQTNFHIRTDRIIDDQARTFGCFFDIVVKRKHVGEAKAVSPTR